MRKPGVALRSSAAAGVICIGLILCGCESQRYAGSPGTRSPGYEASKAAAATQRPLPPAVVRRMMDGPAQTPGRFESISAQADVRCPVCGMETASPSVRRALDRFDRDGDMAISEGEWPGTDEFFARADIDGDGGLDAYEIHVAQDDIRMRAGERGRGETLAMLDEDGDGYVSAAEWPGDKRELADADANGDRRLDRREAATLEEGRRGAQPRREQPARGRMAGEETYAMEAPSAREMATGSLCMAAGSAAHLVDVIDRDRDGSVTRGELDAFADRIMRADADGKGYVTRSDAMAAASSVMQRWIAEAFIGARDADGDGRVTRRELGPEAEDFASLDADGDGAVTETDFRHMGRDACAVVTRDIEESERSMPGEEGMGGGFEARGTRPTAAEGGFGIILAAERSKVDVEPKRSAAPQRAGAPAGRSRMDAPSARSDSGARSRTMPQSPRTMTPQRRAVPSRPDIRERSDTTRSMPRTTPQRSSPQAQRGLPRRRTEPNVEAWRTPDRQRRGDRDRDRDRDDDAWRRRYRYRYYDPFGRFYSYPYGYSYDYRYFSPYYNYPYGYRYQDPFDPRFFGRPYYREYYYPRYLPGGALPYSEPSYQSNVFGDRFSYNWESPGGYGAQSWNDPSNSLDERYMSRWSELPYPTDTGLSYSDRETQDYVGRWSTNPYYTFGEGAGEAMHQDRSAGGVYGEDAGYFGPEAGYQGGAAGPYDAQDDAALGEWYGDYYDETLGYGWRSTEEGETGEEVGWGWRVPAMEDPRIEATEG